VGASVAAAIMASNNARGRLDLRPFDDDGWRDRIASAVVVVNPESAGRRTVRGGATHAQHAVLGGERGDFGERTVFEHGADKVTVAAASAAKIAEGAAGIVRMIGEEG